MKERICKNCKWFDDKYTTFEFSGLCRAALPTVGDHCEAMWPLVNELDWCSEYTETWTPGELSNGTE